MHAAALRKRITVQRPVYTRADNGEQITSYTTAVTRWGGWKAKRGTEGETAGLQVQALQQGEVRLRYESALADLSPTWQLQMDGRTLRIVSVDNVHGRNRDLVIGCVENV